NTVDMSHLVAMLAEAADLRQGAPRRAVLRERRGVPGAGRVVAAEHARCPGQDAARIVPGRNTVDISHVVAMLAEAADLRQGAPRRAVLRERRGVPGAGRVVAAEHARCPGQIPGCGD